MRELSRTASAVAEVAEGAGSLASAATQAAANATIAVTSTASSLASSSLSLAREVWVGVDLLNVTVNRSHGRIVASNYSEISKWMKENTAFAEQSVDSDLVLKPGVSVSAVRPLLEWSDASADVAAGHWASWKLKTRWLPTGQIAMSCEIFNVAFTPRWSNPIWEALGIEPTDNSDEILRVLTALMTSMPIIPKDDLSLEDSALGIANDFSTIVPQPQMSFGVKCALSLLGLALLGKGLVMAGCLRSPSDAPRTAPTELLAVSVHAEETEPPEEAASTPLSSVGSQISRGFNLLTGSSPSTMEATSPSTVDSFEVVHQTNGSGVLGG